MPGRSLLPSVQEQIPLVKRLAKLITLAIYTLKEAPTSDTEIILNRYFRIKFCMRCTDIFVVENELFIPVMTLDKLVGLQVHLKSVGLPYVFEHEALHLIDIRWHSNQKKEWSESLLELRADTIEQLLAEEHY